MLRLAGLLLPALIPSWRFFDEIAPSPRIEVATGDGGWVPLATASPQPGILPAIGRLFWNPDRNEALFLVSLAERVIHDACGHAAGEIMAAARARHPGSTALRIVTIARTEAGLAKTVRWAPDLAP